MSEGGKFGECRGITEIAENEIGRLSRNWHGIDIPTTAYFSSSVPLVINPCKHPFSVHKVR